MNILKNIWRTLKESLLSVLPIVIIVLALFGLQFTNAFPDHQILTNEEIGIFIVSMLFLAIGMSLFSLGSETALTKVGLYIGSSITKRKSIIIIVIVSFLLGLMITIAEPDLTVLGDLVGKDGLINPWIFKITIGVGVGIFLVLGLLRIVFQKSLKLWIIFFYLIIFALACLFGKNGNTIFEISFDSSGVTTGPVTVPFLLTFGAGVASVRGGKNSSGDSFGVTGLCSIGPIVMVMLLFLPLQNSDAFKNFKNGVDSNPQLLEVLGRISLEVLLALCPIIVFFTVYQFIFIKLNKREMFKIGLGFIYTYLGLTVFLSAANMSLIPIGHALGNKIALGGPSYYYLLILIGIVVGLSICLVEPSVHVLVAQVEEVSGRAISKKSILFSLCIGVSLAIVLAVVRVAYGGNFSIMYYYVPLFALALTLTFFVPDIYAAIAFDSGGVASGTMASCFVLPFVIGIGEAISKTNPDVGLISGFGVIGLIAVMPIITIQGLGIIAGGKTRIKLNRARRNVLSTDDAQVIHL